MAYGVLALARPTFDVPYAEEMAAKAFARIDEAGLKTIGPRGSSSMRPRRARRPRR